MKTRVRLALRQNPPLGKTHLFAPGDELPDWAIALVGEHVFKEQEEPKPKAAKKAGLPSAPVAEPQAEAALEAPEIGAHVTKWRAYSERLGIPVPKGTSRDEIQKNIQEKMPDMMPEAKE